MTTVVVTGSASGIGAATAQRLRDDGATVIGVDRPGTGAEVEADLATDDGRAGLADQVRELTADGSIDGLVAGAGVQSMDGAMAGLTVRTNLFGAVATLERLRPLLAAGSDPSAVAISSNSTTTMEHVPAELIDVLLAAVAAGDEDAAVAAVGDDAVTAYPLAKLALARWVRRAATTDDWIGSGIRLNAIAPGFVATPMTAGTWDFVTQLGDVYPVPIDRPAQPEELAALLSFLLSPDSRFFVGSFIVCDGGTDARVRADDWPSVR